jgi:hypothetical protein
MYAPVKAHLPQALTIAGNQNYCRETNLPKALFAFPPNSEDMRNVEGLQALLQAWLGFQGGWLNKLW